MSGIEARRRPRVSSANFRRLRWVLSREAALALMFPDGLTREGELTWRRVLARQDTSRVEAIGRRYLSVNRYRRRKTSTAPADDEGAANQ